MKSHTLYVILFVMLCTTMTAQNFTLSSTTLGGQLEDKQVFNGFGCTGTNTSPQLQWSNAPKETKSFAITIHDKDAPTGSGWWHWIVFDIPNTVSSLAEGAGSTAPEVMDKNAIQSITDFGTTGYGGPCPPEGHGFHEYKITVYALDTAKLGLDAKANPALVGFYLNSHTLAKASIIAYYKR